MTNQRDTLFQRLHNPKDADELADSAVEAADEIERLDAEAACEKAEKESLQLEAKRLQAAIETLIRAANEKI